MPLPCAEQVDGILAHIGGTLGGTGSVSGDVTAELGGTVAPGVTRADLATGALTLQTGSKLDVEIIRHCVGRFDEHVGQRSGLAFLIFEQLDERGGAGLFWDGLPGVDGGDHVSRMRARADEFFVGFEKFDSARRSLIDRIEQQRSDDLVDADHPHPRAAVERGHEEGLTR